MVELTDEQIETIQQGGEIVIEVDVYDSEGFLSHQKPIVLTSED